MFPLVWQMISLEWRKDIPMSRRRFGRPLGKRRYKRLFVILTEGIVTEPGYFSMFNNDTTILKVSIVKNKGSAPGRVLKQMKRFSKENPLLAKDEAWIVVDKDQWSDTQLGALYSWSITNKHYGLAVSNPKFEFWLLLHFEDGTDIQSSQSCTDKLFHHLPDYDKVIQPSKLKPHINEAVRRAEMKDQPPCYDWPQSAGTTVYRLVKSIIAEKI